MTGGKLARRRRLPWAFGSAALALALGNAVPANAAADFNAHGSVEQVYVTGLAPEAPDGAARPQRQGRSPRKRADAQGGLLFRNVKPGERLPRAARRRRRAVGPADRALDAVGAAEHRRLQPVDPVERLRLPDHARRHQAGDLRPPAAGRDDASPPGFKPPVYPNGPTPTLIEYSGYGYADPAGPQSGIAILANLMGFTVVDVNMRGTGCSGGAFDFFEPLQSLDGYDVIETIARQPWVAAPQGRDDGHLLRRHQPAVHRRRPTRRAWPRSRRCR